jgi:hypothetical protein
MDQRDELISTTSPRDRFAEAHATIATSPDIADLSLVGVLTSGLLVW